MTLFAFTLCVTLVIMGVCYRVRNRMMPVVGSRLPEDDRNNIAEAAYDTTLLLAVNLVMTVIMAGGALV